ncbi:MAG: murein transglycosylase domain-containing protein [Balneolaceae bacterium]
MKTILLAGIAVLLCTSTQAFAQDTYEEFLRQRQQELDARMAERDAGIFQSEEEYVQYAEEQQRQFDNFRDEMTRQWGDFKERTESNWVEYRQGGKVRWDVDFEEGGGTVEVLADENDTEESLRESIEETILELLASKGTESEMPDTENEKEVMPDPILENQIELPADMGVQEFAKKTAEKAEMKKVVSEDGVEKTIAVINLKLVPDHLRIRAEKFRNEVEIYSKKYGLEPALVFAIIHTESFFNPLAKSHANALGLMQVVPNSAGRDVYRILNGKDAVPSVEYLYDPEQNVLYGSTYFDLLMNRYMRGVKDKTVHEYLVICAYNTGAGNVAKAYTGTTNFNKALDKINSMSAEENYQFLLKNLPWDETKNYLVKVTDHRDKYRKWMAGSD